MREYYREKLISGPAYAAEMSRMDGFNLPSPEQLKEENERLRKIASKYWVVRDHLRVLARQKKRIPKSLLLIFQSFDEQIEWDED